MLAPTAEVLITPHQTLAKECYGLRTRFGSWTTMVLRWDVPLADCFAARTASAWVACVEAAWLEPSNSTRQRPSG